MLNERQRSLLILNGVGLLLSSVLVGWFYLFFLVDGIRLFPIIDYIPADIPGDRRAWNMAHMEGITNGLLLIATALIVPFLKLGPKASTWLFWSSLT